MMTLYPLPTGEARESAPPEKAGTRYGLGSEGERFASCVWPDFYVVPTNHGLRPSVLSDPVDPIQPQIKNTGLLFPNILL